MHRVAFWLAFLDLAVRAAHCPNARSVAAAIDIVTELDFVPVEATPTVGRPRRRPPDENRKMQWIPLAGDPGVEVCSPLGSNPRCGGWEVAGG